MVSVLVHGAGHALSGGWSEARSAELLEGVLDTLEVYAPGIRAQVVADDVMTPADLASAFHLPDGHLFFGEVAVDQLWALRPSMRLSRHQVGIDGLWLGSSGGHGGGALSCVAGSLSADALLSR
jgi:phytoene dehydrogenase-like protein